MIWIEWIFLGWSLCGIIAVVSMWKHALNKIDIVSIIAVGPFMLLAIAIDSFNA